MKSVSNLNVTVSYSYNWRIGFLYIANDQLYIHQRGILRN